jgi:type IV pilus assembly protein PilA
MLILGLLAAIAIPAFFNQRDKAKDASGKAAVRTAETAMETYATDNDGSYTGANNGALENIEPTLNNVDADLTVTPNGAGDGYAVNVNVPDTGNDFSIVRAADGTSTLPCGDGGLTAGSATPGNGGTAGCPSSGIWG